MAPNPKSIVNLGASTSRASSSRPSTSGALKTTPKPSTSQASRRTSERLAKTLRQASPTTADEEDEFIQLNPVLKSRFNSGHFAKASQIIRALREPQLNLERPIFWTDDERILSYELIVAILKYGSFLAEALAKSQFYSKYLEFEEDEVMVVLYNLVERDFRISPEDIPLSDKFIDIQEALLASKTKIMAHMAKLRIKHEANSLDHLLPENLRHQHHIDRNPLYAWINLKKIRPEEVTAILKKVGLKQTEFEDDILIQERLFCIVPNHPDLLRFHSKKSEMIHALPLTQEGKLIVQDKSACIFVYALVRALFFKEALHRNNGLKNLNSGHITDSMVPITNCNEWYDGILDGSGKHYVKPDCVVVTHCGSGRSAAHLACLLVQAVPRYITKQKSIATDGDLCKTIKNKFSARPPLIVVCFGVPFHKHEEVARVFKKQFGLTNFRLFTQEFHQVSLDDARVRRAAAILVNPPSSGSALKDPVSYVCSEGGDENVLTQLSKFVTTTLSEEGYKKYTADQVTCLQHALSFQQVKLIMYTTCSSLRCENSDVVRTCLTEVRANEDEKKAGLFADIMAHKQTRGFRDVSFEIVNLAQVMEGYPENHFVGNFIEIPPSSASSGVFVALIRRKEKPVVLGKNPMRNFIASQFTFVTNKSAASPTNSDGSSTSENLSPASLTLSSSSSVIMSPSPLTNDQELAQYIAQKLGLAVDPVEIQSHLGETPQTSTAVTRSSSVAKNGKKKTLSKKAIVNRVSVPTHASLAKKQSKWLDPEEPKKSSSKSVTGVKSKTSQPKSSGRKPFGHNSSAAVTCTHDSNACVCSRHAKKFPDFMKQ